MNRGGGGCGGSEGRSPFSPHLRTQVEGFGVGLTLGLSGARAGVMKAGGRHASSGLRVRRPRWTLAKYSSGSPPARWCRPTRLPLNASPTW